MYSRPMMFPLDADGALYLLEDEYGNHIGHGSREVCQTLLRLITTSPLMRRARPTPGAHAERRVPAGEEAGGARATGARRRP